jgi:hypothetical protein
VQSSAAVGEKAFDRPARKLQILRRGAGTEAGTRHRETFYADTVSGERRAECEISGLAVPKPVNYDRARKIVTNMSHNRRV